VSSVSRDSLTLDSLTNEAHRVAFDFLKICLLRKDNLNKSRVHDS
jgi:hypothetical protein